MNINVNHPPDYSSIPQDNIILEHYGINELHFESIKKYREKFSTIKPNHPWNGLEIKEFLYKIGAWGKVRNTNKEGLTLAGLLMFSEERIITEVLPQYFLEYRESLGVAGMDWSKRFTSQDGTWSGNVFDFYFKTSAELTANLNTFYQDRHIAQPDVVGCLHEALINALVHSDYDGEGGTVIEKKKSLFRFSNSGLFRISIKQALEGNISNLRNPNLFKMFILIGLCKRTGSGLKGIETTWNSDGANLFDIIQEPESERTMLTLYAKQGVLKKEHLEDVMESEPFLFPEEETQLMSDFSDLDNSINKDNNSYNSEVDSCNKQKNLMISDNSSVNKSDNFYNSDDDSCNNEANSCNKSDNSYNNEITPFIHAFNSDNSEVQIKSDEGIDSIVDDLKVEQEEEEVYAPSSEEVEEELWKVSELARRKKRLNPSTMEEIIVRLCAKRPLMLRELAHLLERTPDGLRNNYLAKLLSKGKIRLKYPNQVNHPKQAYIIVEKQNRIN